MTRMIYIAGYGRSGSTLLSTILGNHADVISVGEVAHLISEWNQPERICSCGKHYRDCAFWGGISAILSPSAILAQQLYSVERFTALPRLFMGALDQKIIETYRNYHAKLFAYIREKSGKPIILDSSKSAWLTTSRFYTLREFLSEDVYVIHLVRDGLAIMESQILRGKNTNIELNRSTIKGSASRTILGWRMANTTSSWLRKKIPDNRYMLLRYEDLIKHPLETTVAIGQFCGLNVSGLCSFLQKEYSFDIGHVVAGNRLRFAGSIKLKGEVSSHPSTQFTPYQRFLFYLLGQSLQRQYGYR